MKERQIEVALNNLKRQGLFFIDRENKIIYVWEQDIRLIKPIPKLFLSKLIELAEFELKDKSQYPSTLNFSS